MTQSTPTQTIQPNTQTRKLQIGVMGSAADLKYTTELEIIAEKLGELIALSNNILIFGAEKDCDSLSTAACRGAKKQGGLTVGITYNKDKKVFQKDADIIISCGLDRGGGREYILALSCDVLIAVSGGSGTLNEIAVAYQGDIPIIVIEGTGGWADQLANKYLDARNRQKTNGVKTPEQAITLAIELGTQYLQKYS